jgi:predicted restriction endonuclease
MTPKEAYALVRVRGISQDIFRGALLRAYGGCCAFSGYRGKGLLEAAHIVPWSLSKPEERLDVSNGLLLSVLHHRLFDLEWLRIDENYRIIVNYAKFKRQALSNEEFALVESLDGKAMQLPADERNWPSRDVIRRRYSDRRS